MNKFTFLMLFIFSSSYLSVSFAYQKCDKTADIHCTYYIGDKSKKNGRYIKTTLISKNAISHIHCTVGGSSDIIPKIFNSWSAGKVKFSYEQCLNAECKESIHLALEEFTIIRDGKKYTSFPQLSEVHILNNYGQPCVVPTKS